MMERRSVEAALVPKLRGEEAIEVLCDFVDELEEQRGARARNELTEKQTQALIKFTRGLISSIETERHLSASDKELRARWLGEEEAKDNQLKWLRYIFTT